jgi:hypothetical protein
LEAVDLFELRQSDYLSDLATTPRFGGQDSDFGTFAGFRHIVVEIDRNEGRQAEWKPGFYRSRVTPGDARSRLIEQALTIELGAENVVRLEIEPTSNSQGRDALKITVVIPPGAIQKLQDGAVLRALVKVQERLIEMGVDRTPIVEYTTEEELAEDGGS